MYWGRGGGGEWAVVQTDYVRQGGPKSQFLLGRL